MTTMIASMANTQCQLAIVTIKLPVVGASMGDKPNINTSKEIILALSSAGKKSSTMAIAATEALDELDAPVVRICTYPAPHAFNPSIDAYLVPSVDRIVREIASMMEKRL